MARLVVGDLFAQGEYGHHCGLVDREGKVEGPGEIPRVGEAIDQLHGHGRLAGDRAVGTQQRKAEGSLQHARFGKGGDEVLGGRDVIADRVHAIGVARPMATVGTVTPGAGGETCVLAGHVVEELLQSPARTGTAVPELVRRGLTGKVDGLLGSRGVVSDQGFSRHVSIISEHLLSVEGYLLHMAGKHSRPDLAAMLGPLGRALMAMERPILEANGITMWGYSVLLALGEEPVRSQAALADRIGADKTRLIADLDHLQERGLITREPDPDDRRVRLIAITTKGRRARDRTQAEIQSQEERILAGLAASDRRTYLRVSQDLAERARAGEL